MADLQSAALASWLQRQQLAVTYAIGKVGVKGVVSGPLPHLSLCIMSALRVLKIMLKIPVVAIDNHRRAGRPSAADAACRHCWQLRLTQLSGRQERRQIAT
jgi:hypothetical protein